MNESLADPEEHDDDDLHVDQAVVPSRAVTPFISGEGAAALGDEEDGKKTPRDMEAHGDDGTAPRIDSVS